LHIYSFFLTTLFFSLFNPLLNPILSSPQPYSLLSSTLFSPVLPFSVEFTTANANVGVVGWRKPNVGVNSGKMLALPWSTSRCRTLNPHLHNIRVSQEDFMKSKTDLKFLFRKFDINVFRG